MRKLIGPVIVAVVVLVPVAASAECAWVLWDAAGFGPETARDWIIRQSYESLRACEAGRERWIKSTDRARGAEWQLTCLPDTIDPRGPAKGGGR